MSEEMEIEMRCWRVVILECKHLGAKAVRHDGGGRRGVEVETGTTGWDNGTVVQSGSK